MRFTGHIDTDAIAYTYTITDIHPPANLHTLAATAHIHANANIYALPDTAYLRTLPTSTAQARNSGYLDFDDCNTIDSSGHGYTGVMYGDPQCAEGVMGKALKLDGIDDWFSLQALPEEAYTFRDFSISLWFNADQDTLQTLIQSSDGHAWGLTGYGISITSLNDIEASYRSQYPDKCEMHATGDFANAWHHVVLIRDIGKREGSLYIDGLLADSCEDPNPDLLIRPQSYPRIGYGVYAPDDYEQYFDGLIDEVRMYNKPLTTAEIQALHGSWD
jgi:hypothetical protein